MPFAKTQKWLPFLLFGAQYQIRSNRTRKLAIPQIDLQLYEVTSSQIPTLSCSQAAGMVV
jgi:hypothetical protein